MATTYTASELAPEADATYEQGLLDARAAVGEHELMIDGQWRPGQDRSFAERNPAHLDERLGVFASAADEDVAHAITAARNAQRSWRHTSVEERIAVLDRAADYIAAHAGLIAAVLSLEVGKNRLESMGEVDEVIELIRYYSRQAAGGFDLPLAQPDGYENQSVMRPYGVFGVIAPFNFPLALLLGPSVAAMLTGNTVVGKPSPTTSGVGVLFAQALLAAGLPDGVFNLLTGGDATGRAMVAGDLDGIVFTGSYAVGQKIATQFGGGARYQRPCITEMGGKNSAIVMPSADLSAAVQGITRSAFGLSGQRCSACSRVLVHEDVHDELVAALVAQTAQWVVADPTVRGASLGPVHEAGSVERFRQAVNDAQRDGEVFFGGHVLEDLDGFYVSPSVVGRLPVGHRLLREEQFVPFVAVEAVADLDSALEQANDVIYGLTAGMFSRELGEIDTFLDNIETGTVFVNRAGGATSGGWPGEQSYSGWKGSGSTNRGGLGPRYVEQFLREQGRNIVAIDA